MTPKDVADLIAGLGSFFIAALALWRSFRNDGRHWIEKLFQTAIDGLDSVKAEQKSFAAQTDSKLNEHYVNRREFERHEIDQRETLNALRSDMREVGNKIDELKDIMIGRNSR